MSSSNCGTQQSANGYKGARNHYMSASYILSTSAAGLRIRIDFQELMMEKNILLNTTAKLGYKKKVYKNVDIRHTSLQIRPLNRSGEVP